MATLSDLYSNLKTLLSKTYLEKKSNNYHQNGIVTTNNNREITTTQSLSYDSLSNKPTIPTKTSDLINDSGFQTGAQTIDSSLSSTSTNPVQNKVINSALNNKSDNGHTHNYSDLNANSIPSTFPPSSHTHSSNDVTGLTASMNVVTNSSGKLTTESKPTIPSASSTTPKADVSGGAIGSGTTWAKADHQHPLSSAYASGSHTHSGDDVTGLTANKNVVTNSNGKLTTEAKYTHPTTLNNALSTESLYKITANTDGHITKGTIVGIDSTSGGTSGSSNLITSGAVNSGLSGKLDGCVTYTTSYPTSSFIDYTRRIVKFTRFGDIVLVEYSVQSSNTIASGAHYGDEQVEQSYTICYIPQECIPNSSKYIDVKTISTGGTDVRLILSANGSMRINQSETNAKKINMFGSFVYNRTTETY